MHIALINRLSGYGGIAVYNQTLAQALARTGHWVSIITSHSGRGTFVSQDNERITIHRLPSITGEVLRKFPVINRYWRSFNHLVYSFRLAKYIEGLDRRNPPDVLEFAEVSGEAFFYLLRRKRLPVVVRCHTPTFVLQRHYLPEEMPYDIRLEVLMEKYSIRHADALTSPSVDMAVTISKDCEIPVERLRPIPNAVDVERYARDWHCDKVTGEAVVLHVGRMERVKGVDVLAQAIPAVLAQAPNFRFVFIGAARSDEVSARWAERLKALGGERVSVLGCVDELELIAWYHRADIAVVPSLNYESFSYTCAQAMAAGLPVVASRIGGIPETVADAGSLIPPGDVAALAHALLTLAADPDKHCRLGQLGKARARMFFNSPVVAQQMLAVYRDVQAANA